jgi:hypothetical protein
MPKLTALAMTSRMKIRVALFALLGMALGQAWAQTVSPVIVEYKEKADGKFALTNDTTSPMVVVIEPKSFTITRDGAGVFRPLDPNIHLELSAMSVKLAPQETYYVFYKATAKTYPAWFSIYSTFARPKHQGMLDIHLMLPHTVYLLQKNPLKENEVHVQDVAYDPAKHKIICDLENEGQDLGRVQDMHATGEHASISDSIGFPLLPGSPRHVEIDWKGSAPPHELSIQFEHFTLKRPIENHSE